jgi:hypothetical protein
MFLKKLENIAAAVALHVAHYNFCRVHGGLEKITRAMAAGVIGELWAIEDLYDAVMGRRPIRSRAVRNGGFFMRGGTIGPRAADSSPSSLP